MHFGFNSKNVNTGTCVSDFITWLMFQYIHCRCRFCIVKWSWFLVPFWFPSQFDSISFRSEISPSSFRFSPLFVTMWNVAAFNLTTKQLFLFYTLNVCDKRNVYSIICKLYILHRAHKLVTEQLFVYKLKRKRWIKNLMKCDRTKKGVVSLHRTLRCNLTVYCVWQAYNLHRIRASRAHRWTI